jgi:outer membrane protein insertion porin family
LGVPFGTASSFQTKGYLFVDAGTLLGIDDDNVPGSTVLDDASIRLAAGFGVGVKTPFGVIRLNYAFPILKADFDRTESFSFRFGTSF